MSKILWMATVLSAIFLPGCQGEASKADTTEKQRPLNELLPGTWETISIRVEVNTTENTDSSYIFEVKEEEWASRLGSRPILFYFQPDNKYRQEFVALNDEVMSTARGIWNTFGDTLMLIEPNATYQYQVAIGKGLAEFRTMLDWDGDGQEDDSYSAVHRQVSMTTE